MDVGLTFFYYFFSPVVWNPWDKKAKAMADFGYDEYKHMLCVEAANIEKAVTLKPGEEWKGRTCSCRRVRVGLLSLGYILGMFCCCVEVERQLRFC